jgi:hypothetical protein
VDLLTADGEKHGAEAEIGQVKKGSPKKAKKHNRKSITKNFAGVRDHITNFAHYSDDWSGIPCPDMQ